MMTLEDSEEHRLGAMVAGADAFLPKDNFAHGFHAVVELLFGTSGLNNAAIALTQTRKPSPWSR